MWAFIVAIIASLLLASPTAVNLPIPTFTTAPSTNSGDTPGVDETPKPDDVTARFLGIGQMPDLVGISAVDAIELAEKSGYYPQFFQEVSGELDDIYYTKDETDKLAGLYVCTQTYPVGAAIDGTSWQLDLKLVTSSSCAAKTNPFRLGTQKISAGDWEPKSYEYGQELAEGWVFGYTGYVKSDLKVVQVMTTLGVKEMQLAQIEPTADGSDCDFTDDELDANHKTASEVKQQLLPIGQPVSLVLDGSGYEETSYFFHKIDSVGAFTEGNPPVNSVNEQLVKTGLWTVDSSVYKLAPDYVKPTMQKYKIDKSFLGDAALDKQYAARMLKAANQARRSGVPVMKSCLREGDKTFIAFWGKSDARGDNDSGGSVSGGGGGCTWVNGYWRGWHHVSGYWRC
ncbi:MAG: hypothetical protein RIS26_140 [Actinomycetota bacterium]|jgi:hypothetical protein